MTISPITFAVLIACFFLAWALGFAFGIIYLSEKHRKWYQEELIKELQFGKQALAIMRGDIEP